MESLSPLKVTAIAESILKAMDREHPNVTVAEMMSAVMTVLRGLIAVMLEHGEGNDKHNRAEVIRCLELIESDVWKKGPTTLDSKVN